MATIKEIKAQLQSVQSTDDSYLLSLLDDQRVGVQKLIKQRLSQIKKQEEKVAAFKQRFFFERQHWQNNEPYIAGIDEVGRGCLAGPVVTAAVILDDSFDLIDVNDSKQLSATKREKLYPQIIAEAKSVGIGVCTNQEIDELGILNATKVAMKKAIQNLEIKPQHLLVDAVQIPTEIPKTVMFKGDAKSISIAAASIVAKEYRDHLMASYHRLYPNYGFDKNVGYGTAQHLAAIKNYGITPIHRKTFEPIPQFLN